MAATVAIALLAPAAGSAQTPLPVGEAKGVRIERGPGLVIVFTEEADRLRQRFAGKRLVVECVELPDDTPGLEITSTGEYPVRVPVRGRRVRTGDHTRGIDFCRLWRPSRTVRRRGSRVRLGRSVVVSIPLTQKGAVHLDEEAKARKLALVLVLASVVADKRKAAAYPTYDQLLDTVGDGLRRLVVPLASPADTPPAGRVGYFSDGREHVAVAILSASGRRLFVELAADDVVHTNIADQLVDLFD